MLTLTFMSKEIRLNIDIQVNSQQKILDTIYILKEAHILQGMEPEYMKVKSIRKGMYVNIDNTYEVEHINTSDILELV